MSLRQLQDCPGSGESGRDQDPRQTARAKLLLGSGDLRVDIMPAISPQEPVQIIIKDEENQFKLDEKALEMILLQEDIKDLPIAVVSVAGGFRLGNSFILNFFLRYLKCGGKEDWLGEDNVPLEGFTWRGGSERVTTGILLWPEVFKVITPSGEEIAVLLMDTQGAIDSHTTVKDWATICSLSNMISSVQVYSVSQNIQQPDLDSIQLFAEYGKLWMECENCSETPFQKLVLLVRDWSYPYAIPYGIEGGKKLLERTLQVSFTVPLNAKSDSYVLMLHGDRMYNDIVDLNTNQLIKPSVVNLGNHQVSEKQRQEIQSVRKHFRACFRDISCFLMPHPGLKVVTNPNFDGRLSEMESDFKQHLLELAPLALSPKNLVIKQIGGNKVKAKELVHYFQAYSAIYNKNALPEPKSNFEATAEVNNLYAVSVAKDFYRHSMEKAISRQWRCLTTAKLEREHVTLKEKALEIFNSGKKMGSEEFSLKHVKDLEREIEYLFTYFREQHGGRNKKSGRKPGLHREVAAIVIWFLSMLFWRWIFGMTPLNEFIFLLLTLACLVVWFSVHRNGSARDVESPRVLFHDV